MCQKVLESPAGKVAAKHVIKGVQGPQWDYLGVGIMLILVSPGAHRLLPS